MKKMIISVILTIIFYYFLSIFFTKNGQFVQYSFSHSNNEKESIEKEIFLTNKLNILFIKDSANIVKNNFNIWLDKSIITRRYGFLPIRFRSENNRFNSININFKSGASDTIRNSLSYKIHNESYKQYEITSVDVKKGTKLKVDFYFNKKLISKIEIVIPKE